MLLALTGGRHACGVRGKENDHSAILQGSGGP